MPRRARRRRFLLFLLAAFFAAILEFYAVSAGVAGHVKNVYADVDADATFVEADGIRTHFREFGTDGLPVLVLVHGFLGSSFDYLELADGLDDAFHLFAIDLVGFGLSDKPLDFDYGKASQADHLDAVVDALGLTEFFLGGHSMGGEVAIHYALSHPERVTRLVLFASAGLSDGAPGPLPTFLYAFTVKNYFLQRLGYSGAYEDAEVGNGGRFDRMFAYNATIPAAVMRAFSEDDDSGSVADHLGELDLPVLLVWGTRDRFIPASSIDVFLAVIPDAEGILITGAGHLPFQECPDETAAFVRTFLLD